MGKKGTILLHVMVTSVLVALIAATLLRLSLLRVQAASRGQKILTEKRLDQGALASIVAYWNSVNMTCANNVPNYSCAPAAATIPGSCGCTCTPTVVQNPPLPTVTTNGTPASCQLNIGAANDIP
jgi:hypothetical protein